jgi:hypothetical protein
VGRLSRHARGRDVGWRGTGTPLAQMTARPTIQIIPVSGVSTLPSGRQPMDDDHGMAAIVLPGVVFLAATSLLVPTFRKLGMSAIMAFLAIGVLIGPSVLGLLPEHIDWTRLLVLDPDGPARWLAELGVVFLLFAIGLEVSTSRLWALRRWVLGFGLAQAASTRPMMGSSETLSVRTMRTPIRPGWDRFIYGSAAAASDIRPAFRSFGLLPHRPMPSAPPVTMAALPVRGFMTSPACLKEARRASREWRSVWTLRV